MTTPTPSFTGGAQILQDDSNLTPKMRAFLIAYEQTGGVNLAARAAGVSPSNHPAWLRESPYYAEAFRISYNIAVERMEAELRRRSLEGIQEPVVYKGQYSYPIGPDGQPDKTQKPLSVTRYSDTLLMFALKAHLPEKYKDRSEVQTGWDGDVSKLSRDQIKKLTESLAAMAFGNDQAALQAATQELDAGVIDVTAQESSASGETDPELGSASAETGPLSPTFPEFEAIDDQPGPPE